MLTIGIYTIEYNRQERAWEVTGEEKPHRFLTGSIGKRAAIKFAIHKAYPKLAEAVERFSAKRDNASGRAWAAAQLLIGGHVLEPGSQAGSNCVAQVMSQQNGRYPSHYLLCQQADKLTCTCADYEAGGVVVNGQGFCKHGLAYLLGLYLNWPLQPVKADSLPPVVRLRREAGGRWRGRTVIRVNNSATRQGNGLKPDYPRPGTPSGIPAYTNGEPVSAMHQPAYASFVAVTGQTPFNNEKLMSWYYGR